MFIFAVGNGLQAHADGSFHVTNQLDINPLETILSLLYVFINQLIFLSFMKKFFVLLIAAVVAFGASAGVNNKIAKDVKVNVKELKAMDRQSMMFKKGDAKVMPSIQLNAFESFITKSNHALKDGDTYVWDFEDEAQMNDWVVLDEDGDGYNWEYINDASMKTHSGTGLVSSASYDNPTYTALYPDNWLVSPWLPLHGKLGFYACGQDASYASEVFGVYIYTSANSEWVQIGQDITVTGTMKAYAFDLSEYEGLEGSIAIVHHNVTDMFRLNVDDITIGEFEAEPEPETPTVITEIPEGCQVYTYYRNSATIYSGWFGISATITDGKLSVQVAGNAVVNILTDGEPANYRHEGAATTLTFTPRKGEHIRGVKVYNVATIPARNEAGYYVVSANDGAALMLLLEMAQDGDKIFLLNGTYDLGHMTLTPINAQISLIGQSMDGVLIQNHPLTSGMNNAETLVLKADNIYMQDLSIRCDVSYPTSIAHGVGIAVQVQGDKSIFKHVSLQGNQDTYYSNGSATQRGWFGDGRIEGTVDYICGGGDIWFENVLLYNNDRKNDDVIIAPATESATQYGYVFNRCMIDGVTGQAGRWHLGRGWKNSPAGTWLNTTCRIAPSKQGYTHMNAGLKVRFHEYNTQRVDGTIFVAHNLDGLGYAADSDPIYLDGVCVYTYENVVLGADNWDAAAIAAQVTANPAAIDVDAAYLVEENGAFVAVVKGSELNAHYKGKTIRQANSRGGFGKAVRY